MKMKVTGLRFLLLSALMLPTYASYASLCCNPRPCCHTCGYFDVIGAGSLSQIRADDATLGVTSDEFDRLVSDNDNNWKYWGGQLGVGYVYYIKDAKRFSCGTQWFPSIEPQVNIYYTDGRVEGDVLRFGSGDFNELNFKATAHSTRLMADAALTVVSRANLSLFVIGGLGEASTKVKYSDSVNDDVTCDLQGISLASKTNSNFAWEVGAGVTYAYNYRIGVSAEYLYTDLGKLRTSGNGNTGTIALPVITPARFNVDAQAILLGLHVALG